MSVSIKTLDKDKTTMIVRFISVIALTAALISGCSIYNMDIQQGNYLAQEQLSQVRPGMSYAQVQELLGTPLLTDDFRQNRWDYVFYLKEGKTVSRQTGVTVLFNEQGAVTDIRTDQ